MAIILIVLITNHDIICHDVIASGSNYYSSIFYISIIITIANEKIVKAIRANSLIITESTSIAIMLENI